MEQSKAAQELIDSLNDFGHEHDISVLDLLDCMACLGIEFARGSAASDAYFQRLTRGTP